LEYVKALHAVPQVFTSLIRAGQWASLKKISYQIDHIRHCNSLIAVHISSILKVRGRSSFKEIID
jgi:hypothetical protein